MTAIGTFDVEITPQDSREGEGSTLGRSSLAKTFHGGLEGTSEGTMLTALTPVEGAAGYVAVERVTGTLEGRSGSFALQHFGLMADGRQDLRVEVVPGSGSGELEGIRGTLRITVEADGTHRYALDYTLP